MSDAIQIGYGLIIALCTIISTALQWRKRTREREQVLFKEYDKVQQIQIAIQSQLIDLLVTNLLPVRSIYIDLSINERIRKEFELIFNKPQEMQAISAQFCRLLELQLYPRKLARTRNVQRLSTIIGVLALIGALLPLVALPGDGLMDYGLVSKLSLSVVIVSVAAFTIASIMKSRLEHRLQSILHSI